MTISVCMIVKNEEKVLARCLDSLAGLYEELIIVDTGSTDSTKQIAARYTDKIYDFEWINDFSAARNFAFSHATSDYIYSADADEVLDEKNREQFLRLKECLLPEIEIVQMKYGNQLSFGTVYNFDEEYRPKLFKRLRTFTWIEPVHEQVRLDPVVYDSDIVITHMPENNHCGRDFKVFLSRLEKGEGLSNRLWKMYARELFLSGSNSDFGVAKKHFEKASQETEDEELFKVMCCVLTRAARISNSPSELLKYSVKIIASGGCSEVCMDMGLHYEALEDYQEAIVWFYNAAYETQPIIKAVCGNIEPLEHLVALYEMLGNEDRFIFFKNELDRLKTADNK